MSAPSKKIVFLEGGEDVDADAEYRQLVEESTIEECALQLPRGYISVSQVDTYRMCPLRYKFRYVDGLIRPPSAALIEGSAVHEGVATGHIESVKLGKTVPLDIMMDAFSDSWKKKRQEVDWKREDSGVNERDILKRDRTFLTAYNQKFIDRLEPQIIDGHPAVERRFWVTVGNTRVPVLGFIDLVAKNHTKPAKGAVGSGEIEVIDHKVTSKLKSQTDVDTSIQLTTYAAVMGVSRVRFQCFVKTKTPYIGAVAATRDSQSWKWAQFVIEEVAKCIAAGVFPPGNDGWHCSEKYCGYYDICRGRRR